LKKYDNEVKEERKEERDQMVEDIKIGVFEVVNSKVDELKEMTKIQ
jgi:hypothetical protein